MPVFPEYIAYRSQALPRNRCGLLLSGQVFLRWDIELILGNGRFPNMANLLMTGSKNTSSRFPGCLSIPVKLIINFVALRW
jgi:hypothetical protein